MIKFKQSQDKIFLNYVLEYIRRGKVKIKEIKEIPERYDFFVYSGEDEYFIRITDNYYSVKDPNGNPDVRFFFGAEVGVISRIKEELLEYDRRIGDNKLKEITEKFKKGLE